MLWSHPVLLGDIEEVVGIGSWCRFTKRRRFTKLWLLSDRVWYRFFWAPRGLWLPRSVTFSGHGGVKAFANGRPLVLCFVDYGVFETIVVQVLGWTFSPRVG